MQTKLYLPKIKKLIITKKTYDSFEDVHELILYCDNILEGISLLNTLSESDHLLTLSAVVYEPIDQPIYIFLDSNNKRFSVKICGSYNIWDLPTIVKEIISYVDVPDYVFYSLKTRKAILAGENTETASVGNSQWQREGRKIGSAKNNVPFIYQTFYSGLDESRKSIREPSSFQVYNHLVYSARYKTPSFVSYFSNNFDGAETRVRCPLDSHDLFSKYVKSILLVDKYPSKKELKKTFEKEFFLHMISYLDETKYSNSKNKKLSNEKRIVKDIIPINKSVSDALLNNKKDFVDSLIQYIYNENDDFITNYKLDEFDISKFVNWKPTINKKNARVISSLSSHLRKTPITSLLRNFRVGLVLTEKLLEYLIFLYPQYEEIFRSKLTLNIKETIIFPTRIWKYSNSKLTLSPDPESGEIVAFCELLSKDINGNKTRNVFGLHIVDIPCAFKYSSVMGISGSNKINKAIANYFDLLLLTTGELVSDFTLPNPTIASQFDQILANIKPNSTTEETAIVSAYINQSTIKSDWKLCFIHTHHSSWQQLTIDGKQEKINRKFQKVDLIMQLDNQFMLAEGKDKYLALFSDKKIKESLKNARNIIDRLYPKTNLTFDAFVYNLGTNPKVDPEYYADQEVNTVEGGIIKDHFKNITNNKNFVVIIVYINKFNETKFRLVYSQNFNKQLMTQLNKDFK